MFVLMVEPQIFNCKLKGLIVLVPQNFHCIEVTLGNVDVL